jgi:uracil-DNA glycosylase
MTDICIVGEAWGSEEAAARAPFVGPSGKLLNSMLHQSGIRREDCFVTNVFNLQPQPKNDVENLCGPKAAAVSGFPAIRTGKYIRSEFQPELDRLFLEIKNEHPKLIVALGASAAWALLGTSGIKKIRGAPSLVAGRALQAIGFPIKVLPTYHPAAVMRDWSLRVIMQADLEKARREFAFPELIRPRREIWIEPTLDDLARFGHDYIDPSPDLSIDIETSRDQITCIGFAPTGDRSLVVPFVNPLVRTGNYWGSLTDELAAWDFVRKWCMMTVPREHRPFWRELPYKRGVGQNYMYDMNFLWTKYGILSHNEDDTMLLHHALQPELEKSLGFLATIYTDELAWKFMRKSNDTIKQED